MVLGKEKKNNLEDGKKENREFSNDLGIYQERQEKTRDLKMPQVPGEK